VANERRPQHLAHDRHRNELDRFRTSVSTKVRVSIGTEHVDVVIVGGGQAGLAMSYCLNAQGRTHVVLEQARIAESWRTKRWDSLRVISPNWTVRLPGYSYAGDIPDGFMGKDEVVERLVAYAASFSAPVREGVRATFVERAPTGAGFLVRTETGDYVAPRVVIATGALQRPHIPAYGAALPADIAQITPYTYRHPAALPPGAVLVVGSGQSGCQIAEELRWAGRTVYLAVSRSWGMPRRYRGRDASFWFRAVGWFAETVDDLPPGARSGLPNPQLTGAEGGHDLTVYTLARQGVVLMGRLQDVHDGKATFASDLAESLAWGDAQARRFLTSIDDLIRNEGLDAPTEVFPNCLLPAEGANPAPPEELSLAEAGITTVVWATGYRPDLEWVRLPVLDAEGYPLQRRGVTEVPGLYFLGLDWLYKRSSGLFGGMSDDAVYLASVIAAEHLHPAPSVGHVLSRRA
jgi:putative flavoprotein involved in K+ transport